MVSSLTLASQTIGFISFSITLLTLLGVYRDLITTLRGAPTQIPLELGNLRQEILAERAYLQQRCREGRDVFGVFPKRLAGLPPPTGADGGRRRERAKRRGTRNWELEGYVRLLQVTVDDLWAEFQRLERPFLVRSGLRARAVEGGDYWGVEDVEEGSVDEEKGGVRRRRRRRGRAAKGRGVLGDTDHQQWHAAEEDLRREGAKYYNTDLAHRWIWWHTKGDLRRLAGQIQRIQIRRMERDLFETDELCRMLARERGFGGPGGGIGGRSPDGSSGSDSDDLVKAGVVVRSRAGSRAPSRRGSVVEGQFRETVEREEVRRPAPTRQSDREANVAARRTERRPSGPRVEYEILRPTSRGYVVVDDYRPGARRSYSQDRHG